MRISLSKHTTQTLSNLAHNLGVTEQVLSDSLISSAESFLSGGYCGGTPWARQQRYHEFIGLKINRAGGLCELYSFVIERKPKIIFTHVEVALDDLNYYAGRIISDTQVDIANKVLIV